MEKLTVEQRRMVIDYYATKLVEEWPAEMTGLEIEQRLDSAKRELEWRLDRNVNKSSFNNLIEFMLDQQTFDRDPSGWLYEQDLADNETTNDFMHIQFKDMISALINDIAGV